MCPNLTTNDSPKLCECGCGEPAPIAKRTNTGKGHVKGQPTRFIAGHQTRGRKRPLAERFWAKVDKRGPDECWEWTGSKNHLGYGSFRGDTRTESAPRVSWELHNGPIPDGLSVCHNCPGGDNPSCVNPAHLWLGSHAENMADMRGKGTYSPPPIHHNKGEKAPNAHYTDAQIREIRRQYSMGYMSIRKFARLHNMHHVTMWKILKGISYPGV